MPKHAVEDGRDSVFFGDQNCFLKRSVQLGCGEPFELGQQHFLDQILHFRQLGAQVAETVNVHQFLVDDVLRCADEIEGSDEIRGGEQQLNGRLRLMNGGHQFQLVVNSSVVLASYFTAQYCNAIKSKISKICTISRATIF